MMNYLFIYFKKLNIVEQKSANRIFEHLFIPVNKKTTISISRSLKHLLKKKKNS